MYFCIKVNFLGFDEKFSVVLICFCFWILYMIEKCCEAWRCKLKLNKIFFGGYGKYFVVDLGF